MERIEKIASQVHSPKGTFADKDRLYIRLRQKMNTTSVQPHSWGMRRIAIAASFLLVVGLSIACYDAFVRYIAPEESRVEQNTNTLNYPNESVDNIIFQDTPLCEITKRLSDEYKVQITITSPALEQYHITASFSSKEPIQDILAALATVSHCQWRRTKEGYEIFK